MGLGPHKDVRARCGHCSACASNQMLRRTLPTAERTVTPGKAKRKQEAIDKEGAIRERPPWFKSIDEKTDVWIDCGHVSGLRDAVP